MHKSSSEKRWEKVMQKEAEELALKNTDYYKELKARICGYLAGDGCITISKANKNSDVNCYEILFYPDDVKMAEAFVFAFKEIYGKEIIIKKDYDYDMFRLAKRAKTASLDLLSMANFGTYNWRVPANFLATDKMKIEWLKAFFDCEAHVQKNGIIVVQSVNKNGLEDVRKLLAGFGINSKMYKYVRKQKNWSINYLLHVLRKDAVKKYFDTVNFYHGRKKAKLASFFNAEVAEPG